MFTINKSKVAFTAAILTGVALVASGCASSDPLAPETEAPAAGGETIVIGSQAYYSNEIIAEIYAQALENAGFEVSRDAFNSGQRDAYIPALEAGEITLFPEYSGNLLQFFDPETEARTSEDVYAALPDALPEGLFLASNVVPVVSGELPEGAAEIINEISAALTPEGLVALNVQSTVDQESTPDIATAWLTENGLI